MVEHECHDLVGGCHLSEGRVGVSCVGRPWSYTSLGHGVLSPLSGARQLPRGSLWIDLVTVDPLGACGFAPHVLLKDLLSTQHEARHRVCEECRGQWTE